MHKIKAFREQNKLTQSKLGDYIGVSKSFISQVEKGKSKLSPEKLSIILLNNEGWDTSMLSENESTGEHVAAAPAAGSAASTPPMGDDIRKLYDVIDRLTQEIWLQRKEIAEIRQQNNRLLDLLDVKKSR